MPAQSLLILGRQPALGLAELESLYGAKNLEQISPNATVLNVEPEKVHFMRLGGSVKLCRLLAILDTTSWSDMETYLLKTVPEHLQYLPEGKLQLGISVYDVRASSRQIEATGLKLKKLIKGTGRSIRLIPNKAPQLNSAQVIHNKLTGPLGWEFVFVRSGNKTYLALTEQEQDIEAYAARDQMRPKRDAKVGMLPPKLAQIIINLTGLQSAKPTPTVLDPFCGTGVILQEAHIMGFEAYGTDLETRMVEYAKVNIEWLQQMIHPLGVSWRIEQADATTTEWRYPLDTIACETYLGRPFSHIPDPKTLREVMQDVNFIHRKFLQNVARQTKSGFRMCIAVPAWKSTHGFQHLKALDSLEELGYTRMSFVHAGNDELIYHRPDQIVARELVVLQRT